MSSDDHFQLQAQPDTYNRRSPPVIMDYLGVAVDDYANGDSSSADWQDSSHSAPLFPLSPSAGPAQLTPGMDNFAMAGYASDGRSGSLSGESSQPFSPFAPYGGLRPGISLPPSPYESLYVGPGAPPPMSPIPQPGTARSFGSSSPPFTHPSGVQLVETFAPNNMASLQPKWPSAANTMAQMQPRRPSVSSSSASDAATVTNRRSDAERSVGPVKSKSLRRLGTVNRGMSMRGSKPRIVKVRVVSKSDNKSFFSVERTMYQWMYISTAILGNALTYFAVAHPDVQLVKLAQLSATLLSLASLVVIYYAAIYAFSRRRALRRMSEAAAFDDRFGPVAIVLVIVLIFAVHQGLALSSVIVKLGGNSFRPNTAT